MANALQRIVGAMRSVWSGPITSNSPELARLWADPPAAAGIPVGERTALNFSAVWAAVSLIASQVGSLPLILYKREPNGGKSRFVGHRLYELLHDLPNSEMTSMVFRETLQAHVLVWGNGYAEIERNGAGQPIALWPITPDRVTVLRDRQTQALYYEVSRDDGGAADTIAASNMLHIPGLGFDGTLGYSVVSKARESFSLALAAERFGGSFYGNGSTFGGVLQHPGNLTATNKQDIREGIDQLHRGTDRAHRFLILGGGMKYERLGIPPEDAQFLETRKFQVTEVCRWFNLPPHKLRDLERATFSNIEQQSIEFVTDTLRPWLVRWEQEIARKLIAPAERKIQFAEHLVDGLLRGDLTSRYSAYAVGRQWGWLSPDDVCEIENRNPLPGGVGKIYLVPQNMAPADRINDLIDHQVKPAPTAAAPAAGDPVPAAQAAREALDAQIVTLRTAADDHLARAVAAETQLAAATDDNETLRTERETERTAAAEALRQVAALTILRDDAVADLARTRSERDAQAAEALRLAEQSGAATARAAAAEAEATAARTRAEGAEQRSLEAHQALTDATGRATAAEQEMARLTAERLEAQTRAQAAHADIEALRAASDTTTAAAAAQLADAEHRLAEAQRDLVASHTRMTQAEETLAETSVARAAADARATEAERARVLAETTAAGLSAAIETTRAAHAETEAARAAGTLALTTLQTRESKRLLAVMASHRALAVEAMGRLIRRETEKARRQQSGPDKLRTWIANFYVLHEETCREILTPVIRTHLAWQLSEDDPATVTQLLVRRHIEDSTRQLQAVAATESGAAFAPALEALLTRWEADRAHAFADTLFQQEIAYAHAARP